MEPIDVVILAVVVALACIGARRLVRTATGRRACCGGGDTGGRRFRDARVTDTDESHYPYVQDFKIGGMTCQNCVRNVTNALDSVDGTWATVDLGTGMAHVRSKGPIDAAALASVVTEAGYRLRA